MILIICFLLLDLLVACFAWRRGGAPERCVATIFLLAGVATAVAPLDSHPGYQVINHLILWIDLLTLLGITIVALFADRFWPIWIAALQLLAVASHGVRGYNPDLLPVVYWQMSTKVAYPMLVILAAGVYRHQQRRLKAREFSWTFQRRAANNVYGSGDTVR